MAADPAPTLRVAAVQMTTGADQAHNVAVAERLVADAAGAGARLVVLPEKWNLIDTDVRQAAAAEPLDGPSLAAVRGWARAHSVAIVAGSVSESVPGETRAFNTSVVVDAAGAVVGVYRKMHLFDVEVGGRVYRESDGALPGAEVVVCDVFGWRLGLSVCYDLRFPELYREHARRGARVLVVPAAFTATTGAAHWETLLRARAIENQCFVIAAGQVGTHVTGAQSFGHSMVIDPWGIVAAMSPDGEGVVVADLDPTDQDRVRRDLPALEHRRSDVFPSG